MGSSLREGEGHGSSCLHGSTFIYLLIIFAYSVFFLKSVFIYLWQVLVEAGRIISSGV